VRGTPFVRLDLRFQAGGQRESTSSTLEEENKGMNNWCETELEWEGISLFQLFMPLFLFYLVADVFPHSCSENGDEWSVRAQDDVTLLTMPASVCRLVPSPTIHHTFCGSNW